MSDKSKAQITVEWWRANLADRQSGVARGLAARVRRRADVEVLLEPAVQALAADLRPYDASEFLRLVRVLAELRGSSDKPLARMLGQGETKPLSEARFQTLMRAEGCELTTGLIRAIRALGAADARVCNVFDLARDLLWWDDRTRARWAFDYHGAPVPHSLKPASLKPHSLNTGPTDPAAQHMNSQETPA